MRLSSPGLDRDPDAIEITYAGRPLTARPSDTIASALVAAGELACRETRDGERRGVFCGMGVCQECLVQVDGRTGLRACMTSVRPGMAVERQPAKPTLSADAGATARATSAEPAPMTDLTPDVLVVGGGPAGLTAAAVAAEAGLSVVLLDERSRAGGQYFKQPSDLLISDERQLDAQYRAGRALAERARRAGVDLRQDVRVWSPLAPRGVLARGPEGPLRVRPRALVLATGAHERAVPFPGWTLPGVMTTGAAQTLVRAYQVAPGQRVLVAGHGPLNLQVAAELARSGVDVVGYAELARRNRPDRIPALTTMAVTAPDMARQGLGYAAVLTRRRTPTFYGHAIVRAEGDHRVRRATIARIDADGTPVAGTERHFDVDAVCVGYGFNPSSELARGLAVPHQHDPLHDGFVVARTASGRTTQDGIWVIGDGGGIMGSRVAQSAGVLAGSEIVADLAGALTPELAREQRTARRHDRRARRFQTALWRAYRAPRLVAQLADDATPICRCENVTLGTVRAALDDGLRHIGAVKRTTRAGMGGCQGRYCSPVLTEIARGSSDAPRDELELFAPNPPSKPIAIDDLIDP